MRSRLINVDVALNTATCRQPFEILQAISTTQPLEDRKTHTQTSFAYQSRAPVEDDVCDLFPQVNFLPAQRRPRLLSSRQRRRVDTVEEANGRNRQFAGAGSTFLDPCPLLKPAARHGALAASTCRVPVKAALLQVTWISFTSRQFDKILGNATVLIERKV